MSGPVQLRTRWHCAGTEKDPHAGVYFDEEGHVEPLLCPVCNRIAELADLRGRLDDVCALYARDCTGLADSRVALIRERNRA